MLLAIYHTNCKPRAAQNKQYYYHYTITCLELETSDSNQVVVVGNLWPPYFYCHQQVADEVT